MQFGSDEQEVRCFEGLVELGMQWMQAGWDGGQGLTFGGSLAGDDLGPAAVLRLDAPVPRCPFWLARQVAPQTGGLRLPVPSSGRTTRWWGGGGAGLVRVVRR